MRGEVLNCVEYLCHINIIGGMTNKGFKQWLAVLAGLTLAIGAEEASPIHISIWAPGMDEPQLLNSNDDELLIELEGSNWAYVIRGVSGGIALGNENEKGDFWSVGDDDEAGWGGQQSWSSIGLEVNGYSLTETGAFFSVSGNQPGQSSDHKAIYFPDWFVVQADSDGKLALTIAPLINSALFQGGEGVANGNPVIHLTLLADLYRKPPETSGNLTTGSVHSSRKGKVTLAWNFTQGEDAPSSKGVQLASL